MTEDTTPAAPAAPNGALDPSALADHIVARAKEQGVRAEVTINKIPHNIAANICEFMRRVELKGMEAVAWMEAYSFMQQHVQGVPPQGQPPGVPFGGLPPKA